MKSNSIYIVFLMILIPSLAYTASGVGNRDECIFTDAYFKKMKTIVESRSDFQVGSWDEYFTVIKTERGILELDIYSCNFLGYSLRFVEGVTDDQFKDEAYLQNRLKYITDIFLDKENSKIVYAAIRNSDFYKTVISSNGDSNKSAMFIKGTGGKRIQLDLGKASANELVILLEVLSGD